MATINRHMKIWNLLGFLVIVSYLLIPKEPTTSGFVGLSIYRWILIFSSCLIMLACHYTRRQLHQIQDLWEKLAILGIFSAVIIFISFILFLGNAYGIYAAIALHNGIAIRILPISLWLLFIILDVIIGLRLINLASMVNIPFELRKTIDLIFSPSFINRSNKYSKHAVIVGIIAWIIISLYFIYNGQPNSDEGFYLYASKLIYSNKNLYSDFAFTQMPLLPYFYGLFLNLFGYSLLSGRFISFALSIVGLIISSLLIRRFSGFSGVILSILFYCAYLPGMYFNVIVKTYSLLSLIMIGTIFVLFEIDKSPKLSSFVIILSLLSVSVRLSALPFALIIILYTVYKVWTRVHWFYILAPVGIWCLLLMNILIMDPQSSYWNLFKYHMEPGKTDLLSIGWFSFVSDRFWKICKIFITNYGLLLLVPGIALWVIRIKNKHSGLVAIPFSDNTIDIIVSAFAILGYMVMHTISGRFFEEYMVPAIVTIIPLAVIIINKQLNSSHYSPQYKVFLLLSSIIFPVVVFLNGIKMDRISYINTCPHLESVRRIDKVGEIIKNNTSMADKVFTLEYLFTVINSDREVLPGLEMAQFSFTEFDTELAKRYHLVNKQMLFDYFYNKMAKILVFSESNQRVFGNESSASEFLSDNYELIYTDNDFGQRCSPVFVYKLSNELSP